jgi:hypothetical protein
MTKQKLNVGNVVEWASVDFNTAHGKFMLLVLSIIFATLVGTKRRWRLDEAVLAGFAVCCALIHIRFMYFAGIVLPPILAPQIENLCSRKPYQPAKTKKVLNGLMIGIPCMLTVLRFPSTSVIDQRVREYFPVQALEFLKARPLEGNIFNPYDWGGYIEWTAPEIKTFVDSRTDIFEYKGVLKDYLSVSRLQDSQEILDHYNIQYVLYKSDSALSYFLSHTPNWKPVYRDKVAIVFERVPDRCSVQDLR